MSLYPQHSPFLLAGIMLSILLIFTWKKHSGRIGQLFLLMIALALFWNIAFFLELILSDLNLKILMVQFQFVAIAFIPVVWFAFICFYTTFPTTVYHWIILSIIPIITNILIWLVPRPNWFWSQPVIAAGELFPVLNYNYQFWFYYVHAPVSYGVFLLSIALLLRAFLKKASVYRFQVLTLLVALLLPLLGDLIYVIGFSPVPGVNYSSAMFSFSAVIIAWSLYRYKFLDLLPMAHEIVFDKMSEGILIVDAANRIVDINPSALAILNVDRNSIGQTLAQIDDHSGILCIRHMISNQRKSGSFYIRGELDTQENRYFDCSAVYVDDASGEHLVTVISTRENTAQMMMFRKLHRQSIQDDLTGIFNRRYFFQNGMRILRRCLWQDTDHLSILAIDIDNLKPINDRFGHQTGDVVLRSFSDTTQRELRPSDLFCRMGGDEFAIILPGTGTPEAELVANRILHAISGIRLHPNADASVKISASIGIASTENMPGDESLTIEYLLHIADTHMYEAKKSGGSRVVFQIPTAASS
jgi:diguanylate cyclase (GGDEF)-like protein